VRSSAITHPAELVGTAGKVGDTAVPIAISVMVAEQVAGFIPWCVLVILLLVLLAILVFALTASWRLRPVLS
jgi:hypothetical protein